MVAAQWRLVALVALFATPSCSLHVGAPLAPRFATVAATVSSSSSPALITPSRSSAFDVVMQEDGRETSKSRGRTAVIQRPKPKPKQSSKEEVDHDKSWRVLLHNDDVRCRKTSNSYKSTPAMTFARSEPARESVGSIA